MMSFGIDFLLQIILNVALAAGKHISIPPSEVTSK